MIFILLLLLDSGISAPNICSQSELKVLPQIIPNHSYDTPEGYKVDWKAAIKPVELAECFNSVTLHYNGRPGTDCCYGYESVTKTPKETGDVEPFLVSLCGNQTKVFFNFKIWGAQKQFDIQLKNLSSCSSTDWDYLYHQFTIYIYIYI